MPHIPAQMTTTSVESTPLWLSRWRVRRWAIYDVIVGVGYLANLLSAGQLTLAHFLVLTVIYGAWLGVFHLGIWLGMGIGSRGQPPLWWTISLISLACASQFIPLANTNLNWLAILTTVTACLIVATTSRYVGLIAAVVLWLSSSLAFSLRLQAWDLNTQLTLLITFASFVGVTMAMRELALAHLALADSNAKLAAAHTQLQEYSAQVEEVAAIRERNRIAREIHDTLGHSLTILAVQLETATQYEARGDPGLHDELREARRVASACLTDVRHSVEALRPDEASDGSLQERLRRLAAEFAATSRETAITLDLDEATHSLSPALSMTLYRCAQEALTNIRKHARATKALLYLSTSDDLEGQVELTVLDNGQGITDAASADIEQARGFGLRGMRERVALLGGTVRAGPEPEHGWRVAVLIPLCQRAQAEVIAQTARAEE
ncbi:MAG TPA: sensor histidine kinase [Ktedonobacterales bacterium]|nr:sensor histidine kinase [Ktedonobacterales bacterium]